MQQADQLLEITFCTDPLCCWSWAFEPQLKLIKESVGEGVKWYYRMGGLLPSWKNFNDQINSVTRPAQMGPVWMHCGQLINRPINHFIWIKDPPASSYPCCIAVKCAQLQSEEYGEKYFHLLQQACMTEGKNIALEAILFGVAIDLNSVEDGFDFMRFQADYLGDKGLVHFREDLQFAGYHTITRFPTLIIKSSQTNGIVISGYKNSTEVIQAIASLQPGREARKIPQAQPPVEK